MTGKVTLLKLPPIALVNVFKTGNLDYGVNLAGKQSLYLLLVI